MSIHNQQTTVTMMRTLRLSAALLAGLVLSAACASASGGERGSSDVITLEEIQGLEGMTSAYDVIQRLRPRFLRGRTGARGTAGATDPLSRTSSPGSGSGIVVYVNGVRSGGVDALRRIQVRTLAEIRYVGGSDATTKYGTGHGAGVIEVSVR